MTTSLSPDARRIWRAARGPIVVSAVVLAVAIVITLFSSTTSDGALDPNSVAPTGSRALAHVLQSYGVQIKQVDNVDDADDAVTKDATLLVTNPNWVAPQRLSDLAGKAGDTVLIGLNDPAEVTPSVRRHAEVRADTREPGCRVDAARAAGNASIGGIAYVTTGDSCYEGTLAQTGHLTLLGDGTPLTNDGLDDDGDAALTLRLLGQHQRLVWYTPSLADATAQGGQKSFMDLIPAGWSYGCVEVVVAVLLLMLWRARRLGPVVTEPLPVVVRAAETTEGRARLYRKAKATDHAADSLRQATLSRLIPMLGLAADASLAAVIERAAARTGRAGTEIHAVLYGPPPQTEQALVHLADALDNLTNEVRTQ
jgi:uncharacterized protein DUF4350